MQPVIQPSEQDILNALPNAEFFVLYQPEFDVRSHQIKSLEALVRWRDKKFGIISPAVFIPVLEKHHKVGVIFDFVLNEALRQMHGFQCVSPSLSIAVNVSADQTDDENLPDKIKAALHKHKIEPKSLELEITETALLKNKKKAVQLFERIGQLGVSLALDDFGTGFSDYSYLKMFRAQKLKIDRSFLQKSPEVVGNLIRLGHFWNMKVTAEGCETVRQFDILHENDCDYVQGFLFAKPMNEKVILKMLRQERDTLLFTQRCQKER